MRNQPIEELIVSWFEKKITPQDIDTLEKWKAESEENRQLFTDSVKVLEGIDQLRRMKKYDAGTAINHVNARIDKHQKGRFMEFFKKVAAVLVLPLLITSLFLFFTRTKDNSEPQAAWHTLSIPAGMRSEIYLPDSTKVYLNSKTSLSYPLIFSKEVREVNLTGEAYFEVAENKSVPFVVNAGSINIEVTGTEFIATNYTHEKTTEIVLIEGGLNLFQGTFLGESKNITTLKPGEKAVFTNNDNKLAINRVNTDKYLAWKNGLLVFQDDTMPEVVRRLNRWFNVDIQLQGEEIQNWTYTAIFEDESLEQVLELLKISAPIEYSVKRRELKTDNTFSKMEIIIKQNR